MAVKRQVDQLRKGAMKWNTWREQNKEVTIGLIGADLIGVNLSGADLIGVNLSGANLSGADLSGANLSRTDLSSANLSSADLIGANLIGANLSRTDLSRTDLSRTDLIGANLIGANLIGANLSGANLSRIDFIRADLSSADLIGASLRFADLSRTDLSSANLIEADLSGASLRFADLRFADLIRANLIEADLSYADLSYADLSYADLSNTRAYQTHFTNLDLRTVKGLETINHQGPSHISTSTLEQSNGEIPEIFLKGAGVGESLIEYARSLFRKPIEYYTCFISYSSKDELFAKRLHNDLQQEGIRCWFAPEDMDIGDKIKHRIDESIRMHDKLLLILSEHSIQSSWVAYEVEKALSKEPQGIPNVLYPVRLDQTILTCTTSWAQEIKNDRHIGDFEHWTDPEQYQDNFKRLLRALNAKKEERKS